MCTIREVLWIKLLTKSCSLWLLVGACLIALRVHYKLVLQFLGLLLGTIWRLRRHIARPDVISAWFVIPTGGWWQPCFSFRPKQLWCTMPSTWWPLPRNAPLRLPSAPFSATDTNPGALDHASWTCSKTWVWSMSVQHLPLFAHPSVHFTACCLSNFLGCRSRNSRVRRSDAMNKEHVCDNCI